MSLNYAQIDSLIDALLVNARALVFEAEILHGVSAFARAFALSHLAREELSKCGILHAAGARMLAEIPVDWKTIMRRVRDHKSKLEQETLFQFLLIGETSQLEKIPEIVDYRNDRKNASIYVGITDGRARLPSDLVSDFQAARTIELAKLSLEIEEKIRATMGPFVNRTPGAILGISDFGQMTRDQMRLMLESMGPLYKQVLEHLLLPDEAPTDSFGAKATPIGTT